MKVVFIPGGFLKKNRNGSYGSDELSYLRVWAGYYLYKKLSEKYKVKLIVSGSKGIYRRMSGVPSVAVVMKQELIALGINPKEIMTDKTDFTYNELVWLKKFLTQKQKPEETYIISSAYHLPRVKTMIKLLPELKKLNNIVKPISAEKIVIKFEPNLKDKIQKDYKNPWVKKMIASEKKGIKDLKSGKYKFKK